jgi:hypothetical protein
MPKKKTGQRKKADKQKARLKEIRNKGKIFVEHSNSTLHVIFSSHKVDIIWDQKYSEKSSHNVITVYVISGLL